MLGVCRGRAVGDRFGGVLDDGALPVGSLVGGALAGLAQVAGAGESSGRHRHVLDLAGSLEHYGRGMRNGKLGAGGEVPRRTHNDHVADENARAVGVAGVVHGRGLEPDAVACRNLLVRSMAKGSQGHAVVGLAQAPWNHCKVQSSVEVDDGVHKEATSERVRMPSWES